MIRKGKDKSKEKSIDIKKCQKFQKTKTGYAIFVMDKTCCARK